MRTKRPRLPVIPAKYLKYKSQDWPGGPGQFVAEREAWNEAQPPVLHAGSTPGGLSWAYEAGPLGDLTDCMRVRREVRMLCSARAS